MNTLNFESKASTFLRSDPDSAVYHQDLFPFSHFLVTSGLKPMYLACGFQPMVRPRKSTIALTRTVSLKTGSRLVSESSGAQGKGSGIVLLASYHEPIFPSFRNLSVK